MKNRIILICSALTVLLFASCESLNEGINENPNDIVIENVQDKLFLTGALLANVQVQCGRVNNAAGMYTGQLIGFASIFANQYGFNFTSANSDGTWRALYVGVLTNMRHVASTTDNLLLKGIAQVVEAQSVSTAASIFGDIPYSQAADGMTADPVFDRQSDVFGAVLVLLDEAIATLEVAPAQNLPEDIYFDGDPAKWIQAAYTLKARIHLQMKNYGLAKEAALNGISSPDGDMRFVPRGPETNAEGDKNIFWVMLEGSRAGDIGNVGSDGTQSFMLQMLDPTNPSSRNHAKTNEAARYAYYQIDEAWNGNDGIIDKYEPMNLVTFFENQLILAECDGRESGVEAGLPHLNEVRAWLNAGGQLNSNYIGLPYTYAPLEIADFESGGLENADGVNPRTAFLREVIEERYVSGFGMYMPFNDARRLRKNDQNIAVPFVLVDGPPPPFPERFPYSEAELNANSNAPTDPGLFSKTEVNQ
ncbi:MAG: SusD/RagB family nutrient-binding outer membrane lipoprotein [Saprospiraceae bacterium]